MKLDILSALVGVTPAATLLAVPGIGPAAARRLQAAFALGPAVALERCEKSDVLLDTPDRVADFLREAAPHCQDRTETFRVLLLNTRRCLITIETVATGTLDTILVHSREVFRPAVLRNANAVILTHNHPSGDPSPSEGDIKTTRDLIRAGQLFKIEVLDHVIMGQRTPERVKDFASLRELGYFYT